MVDLSSAKKITDLLEHSVKKFPNKKALLFEGKAYSYKDLNNRVNVVANFLFKKTNKQDVVAILLPNSADFIAIYFGILKAGCIALLIPPNISDQRLIFQIKKTTPKIIFSYNVYKDKINRTGVANICNYFSAEKIEWNRAWDVVDRNVTENDISSIVFTSGSSGEPKGVVLRHSNVIQATKNIIEYLKFEKNDIDVNISALTHSFGLGHVHCVLAVGGTIILFRDSINLKKILSTIVENKATTFGAVPAILRLLISNYADDLRKCGRYMRFIQTNTSMLEPDLIRSILKLCPKTKFNYYYGLTEASRSTFITFNNHLDKLDSMGMPSPNVGIKIFDGNDKELGVNEIGEICIAGKHVISKYWKNPQASRRIKNGWLHTGDVGYRDKDNFFFFHGRKDDIINVSGEKVDPVEIEEIVKKISGVKDAAAVAMDDKLLGQVVKLFISVESSDFDLERAYAECRKNLESFKIPRLIEVIDKIPRTENGKLARFKLR